MNLTIFRASLHQSRPGGSSHILISSVGLIGIGKHGGGIFIKNLKGWFLQCCNHITWWCHTVRYSPMKSVYVIGLSLRLKNTINAMWQRQTITCRWLMLMIDGWLLIVIVDVDVEMLVVLLRPDWGGWQCDWVSVAGSPGPDCHQLTSHHNININIAHHHCSNTALDFS